MDGSLRARIRRRLVQLCLCALVAGSLVADARAQTTTGSVYGTVMDEAGAPVAGARVSVVNVDSGNPRSTVSGPDGSYKVVGLVPGYYSVTALKEGFQDFSNPRAFQVPLQKTSEAIPLPIVMRSLTAAPAPVGTPAATPAGGADDYAELPLINRSDPTRRGSFAEREVEALPLGSISELRTYDDLALLVPGVALPPYVAGGVAGPGIGTGVGRAGQFAVNGLRSRANNFTVDGSDNNDPDVGVRRQGFIALTPQPIESIQEFQLSTLLWDAEAGRNFGSQVNAVSKAGGNEVHGQLYGFFTADELRARDFFDYTGGASKGESPYSRVQTGVVVGAPIVENRTHLFASFEYLDIDGAVEQHFATPTLAERSFLGFSKFGLDTSLGRDIDGDGESDEFLLGYTPPGERTTIIGQQVFGYYPLPNNSGGPYGANTYSEELPIGGRGAIASTRISHQFSQDHLFNARYNFTGDSRTLPSVNQAIRSTVGTETRTHNLSLILDSQLTGRIFNQARFSFGRTRLEFPEHPSSPFDLPITGFVDANLVQFEAFSLEPLVPPIRRAFSQRSTGQIIIEPFSPVGVDVYTFPQRRASNTFQYADTLTWLAGSRHTVKFGADIRRIQLNSAQDRNYRPLLHFTNGLAQFLLIREEDEVLRQSDVFVPGASFAAAGIPPNVSQVVTNGVPNSSIGLRFVETDLFANDNWRVRPNFTLDVGIRYEYNTVPSEVNNRIEQALALEGLADVRANRFRGRGFDSTVSLLENAFDEVLTDYRAVLGGRTRIYDSDPNNVGGHVGFAWDPASDGRTSVRGGYGVYYDAIPGAVVNQSRNLFPNETPFTFTRSFFSELDPFKFPLPTNVFLFGEPVVAGNTPNQFNGSESDFFLQVANLAGFQNRKVSGPFGGITFTLPEKDLATPYAQHWHLTVERSLGEDYLVSAAYVGTKGTKLLRLATPNLGNTGTAQAIVGVDGPGSIFLEGAPVITTLFDPDAAVVPLQTRPQYDFLPGYQVYESSASSVYHALQIESKKRYSSGYTYTLAYTWSHAIDDASDVFGLAGAPVIAQNSLNLALERASANFDARHRFAASLLWDLPFYRGATDGAGRWLGGWQVASIFQASTGQPYTLNVAFDANLDGNLTDRVSTTNGITFFDDHGARRTAIAPGLGTGDFFVLGADGAVGRNTARGDAIVLWDAAVTKAFAFGDDESLELRAEVFNLLNRANFGLPIRTVGSPGFGTSVETAFPNRTVQLAVKLAF